ncbi:hypothetical protein B0O99DRAFT_391680 [Bisporella sp. PMI_857]|nr:hypothetical protein B0O99DRAFT_391680 [Bisporella sp. PMI_857]
MYVNLAISLAVDFGLHNESPSANEFTAVRQEGLVVNGSLTQTARKAYPSAYYISSGLSMGFQKPNHLQYRNLMGAQGESLLQSEHQAEVIALIIIQRLTEKIANFHRERHVDPDDPNRIVNAEISLQIFHSELDQWRLPPPTETQNMRKYFHLSETVLRDRF